MPDIVQCPYCPRKLQVPVEVLGQQVQCPSCGQTFTAGASAPPRPLAPALQQHVTATEPPIGSRTATLPAPVEDIPFVERVPEDPGPGNVEDWRKVRIGVSLVYYGLAALLLAFIVLVVGGGCAGAGGRDARLLGVLVGLVGLLGLVANFAMNLVGQVFCLWAPPENSARSLAIIALVLAVAGPGLTVTGGFVTLIESFSRISSTMRTTGPMLPPDSPEVGPMLSNIGNVLSIFQMLAFLSFMRAAALCLRDGELALSVQPLLALAGVMAAIFIGILFLSATGGGVGKALDKLGIPLLGFIGIAALLSVIYVIWYGRVLAQMRIALGNHILRRASER
jgi:hypothetical protein